MKSLIIRLALAAALAANLSGCIIIDKSSDLAEQTR